MNGSHTADVCELEFPPKEYGSTLDAIEASCQEVVERVFRDDTGFIRGGVHARTMKPMTAAEVPDRPFGRGGGKERSAMPPEMKAAIMTGLEETLWPALAAGTVRPVIHRTLPITQAEEAHAILQRRENIGKVVLAVGRGTP